jgi:E3 ubiquitin-protein ligase SIAH1
MEQLVDSIRVPCPHAAHGCTSRPVYHSRESHARACAHAPCHCPGQACSFVGSTEALLQHFADVHRWPCTTEDKAGTGFDINLHDGFNFVTAIRADANQGTSNQYLFLLNVELAPFGRTITAFCIHPYYTSTATIKLTYSCYKMFDMCCMHRQSSEFKVACTDLSDGLPDSSKCFLFIVPRSARRDNEEFTEVTAIINQTPIQ